jgi:thermitase
MTTVTLSMVIRLVSFNACDNTYPAMAVTRKRHGMHRISLLIVLAWLLGGWQAPNSTLPTNQLPGELVLKLDAAHTLSTTAIPAGPHAQAIGQLLHGAGASAALSLGQTSQTYRVRVRDTVDLKHLTQQLSATPGIVFAEPNNAHRALRLPGDPAVRQQWALRNIQAFEAWDITTGGDITIAFLDTGVSDSHPDLKGRVLDGYDFYNNDPDANDDEGHGTYTAGVAAAEGDNGEGIAGVCWSCKVLPVKVLGSRGQGDDATIAAGIRWAADQGARIISMSLGGDEDTQVLRDAVTYASQRGALLIAASGNGQSEGNAPNYPAAYPEVLAVSATDGSDVVTGFSTYGDFVDISAPGVGVWSTVWDSERGNTYAAGNGTSAAAPYVAGAAALVLTLRPDLNAAQIADILTRSSDDRGAPGKDPQNGNGRLNLFHAVQLAIDPTLNFTPPAPETPVQAPPPAPNSAPAFARVGPPSDGARYFAETGHTLGGAFRTYWERHGGLSIFGFPISEPFLERGEDGRDYTVQYFERHRFEYHPENRPPYDILLSRLGSITLADSGRDWNAFPKGAPQEGCRYFSETGHTTCGAFLRYWQTHGLELDGRRGFTASESIALFGAPISPPQTETLSNGRTVTVQWFERARFEDHGSEGVLLGLLSADLAARRGWR